MRLTSVVTIVLRIYALLWFVEGVVHCIAAIVESHQITGIIHSPFTLYGIWFLWIIVAIIVFFLSQPIARIAVPPPNEQVNVGALSRYDLYCFACTFLGLYFFLSSIGSAINGLHYNVVTSQASHQNAVQQSDALYRLTRPLLTSIAGIACLLLAPKLAHKLSKVQRPTFAPESEQAEQTPKAFLKFMSDFSPLTLEQLEELLPLATSWAEEQERHIRAAGSPLTEEQLADATRVGVAQPQRVRLLAVSTIPAPEHPLLRAAGEATGLISPFTAGLTLRHGIFIRRDLIDDRRLVAHELVHTGQYERFGSVAAFLRQYLAECVTIGYPAAPLEQEAILRSEELFA